MSGRYLADRAWRSSGERRGKVGGFSGLRQLSTRGSPERTRPFLCAMKDGRRRGREGGKEQEEGRTFRDVLTGQSPLCVGGEGGGGEPFEVSYRQLEGCGESE